MIATGANNQLNAFKQQMQSLFGRIKALEGRLEQVEAQLREISSVFVPEVEDGCWNLERKEAALLEYHAFPTHAREDFYARTGIKKGQIVAWKRLKTQGKLT